MAKMSGDVKTRRVISHRIYCHNLLLSSPFEKRCSQPVSSRCKCLLGRVHSFYSHLPSSSCPLDVLRLSLLSTLPDCPTQLHPFSHLPHLGLFSFLYYAFSHVLAPPSSYLRPGNQFEHVSIQNAFQGERRRAGGAMSEDTQVYCICLCSTS